MLRISILLCFQLTRIYSAFPFPEECGINYIPPDHVEDATRIVGGFEAVAGSWPWQAYLKWRGERGHDSEEEAGHCLQEPSLVAGLSSTPSGSSPPPTASTAGRSPGTGRSSWGNTTTAWRRAGSRAGWWRRSSSIPTMTTI